MFMLIFPCGFTKVRFRVLYPIMEYITVIVSLEVNLSEYLPFRLLTVPMAVPSIRTVASSIGSPLSSVMMPPILTCCAKAGKVNSKSRYIIERRLFISLLSSLGVLFRMGKYRLLSNNEKIVLNVYLGK